MQAKKVITLLLILIAAETIILIILRHNGTQETLDRLFGSETKIPRQDEKECSLYPRNLLGDTSDTINFDQKPPQWKKINRMNGDVLPGGSYKPNYCEPRYKVAIIIPFRDREEHLRYLLAHMHPIWKKQRIDYTIYVLSQKENEIAFNKGKLLNVGFVEASKDRHYNCYVFHDVDMLLEDDRCLFWCPEEFSDHPRHLAAQVDKFGYKILDYEFPLCYPDEYKNKKIDYVGGAIMFSYTQFKAVNGFANIHWGWGGEDDDMYFRMWNKGYRATHERYCRYRMIGHDRTKAINRFKFRLLANSLRLQDRDGLNSLRYSIVNRQRMPLYTNITVDVGEPAIAFKKMNRWECKEPFNISDFI